MSQLHLVLGDEDLLVDRAIGAVLKAARKEAGTHDVPVDRTAHHHHASETPIASVGSGSQVQPRSRFASVGGSG